MKKFKRKSKIESKKSMTKSWKIWRILLISRKTIKLLHKFKKVQVATSKSEAKTDLKSFPKHLLQVNLLLKKDLHFMSPKTMIKSRICTLKLLERSLRLILRSRRQEPKKRQKKRKMESKALEVQKIIAEIGKRGNLHKERFHSLKNLQMTMLRKKRTQLKILKT